jgi:hypothetical protein
MNTSVLICLLPIPVIALMILARAVGQTSEGYEDENGFHYKSSVPPTGPE